MREGLKPGETAELEVTVSTDMRAQFGGETVHDLYSTASLVHHMEWVARRIILPYLDSDEEGMGCAAEVTHLKPTLLGMQVRLKATVAAIRDNKIVCEVEAFNPQGKIARGTITQAIVEKSWLEKKLKELSLIHQLSQSTEPSRAG